MKLLVLILKGIKKITGLLAILICSGSLFAQSRYLADFSARIDGEEIYVSWTTKKGFTCENIEVQQGTDTFAMETVHVYLGVCGGELKEEHYFYRIPKPIYNSVNYIRLDLGLYGFSQFVEVKPHKALEGNVLIFPQPTTNASTILFHNPQQQEVEFKVYNMAGSEVSNLTGVRSNQIKVEELNLNAGMYFMHIIIDNRRQVVRLLKSE